MRRLLLTFGLAPLLVGTTLTSTAPAAETDAELAAVRRATARFHDVRAALDAGYVAPRGDHACVSSPMGTMGFHYVHPQRVFAPLDPAKPGALLYVPNGSGGLRLVAVEYLQRDADGDLGTADDRPSIFGSAFEGPMPGHEAGMPVHYDKHVWLWAHNPHGMFAPWNPSLSC